jgi:hypothetical protein
MEWSGDSREHLGEDAFSDLDDLTRHHRVTF